MTGWAMVRQRWVSFLGCFVAVAVGVAVVTMSGLILLSGGTGVPARLAGAPVLVASPEEAPASGVFAQPPPWSPERAERLRGALAALPGVDAAVPVRDFYAQAVGTEQRAGERQGHGWSTAALASFGLTAGGPPAAAGDIVVDRALGLPPGERVAILTAAGPVDFTVSGTMAGPGYYVTDERAAELAGGVRVIGLTLAPGADPARVVGSAREVVGSEGRVLSGSARGALAPERDEMTRWIGAQVVTAMTALSVFVSVFVVSSSFAFTVARRRREFGLLRAIGATPRQLRRVLYGEAASVGVLAAGVGSVLGLLMAPVMAGLLVGGGLQPVGFTVRFTWWVPVAAFALGPAVALVGVWWASRRAARAAPLDAMREAVVDAPPMTRGRWLAGLGLTGLGMACAAGTAVAGPDAMVLLGLGTAMSLTAGLTVLSPAFTRPVVSALTRPLAISPGATAMLVRESVRTAVRRTSASVAPVLATVAFAVLITSTVETTAGAETVSEAAAVRAEAAIVPRGTPGLSAAAVAGVEGTAVLSTTVYPGAGGSALLAAGVFPEFEAVRGAPAPAEGTVVVSAAVAAAHGLEEGAGFGLVFDDGRTERLRVAAVIGDDLPHQLLLPAELVRARDPSALADVVFRTGGPPARPAAELGAEEVSVLEQARGDDAEEEGLIRLFTLILVAMTAGYTAIAVGSTLLTATSDRARDFRVLRLSGASRRQVLMAVAGETCCVVAIGAVLGLAAAAPALLGMGHGLGENLGVPVEPVVAWPWVVGSVGGCLLVGLAASVLPARRVLRRAGVPGAGEGG
ncbi:ABC transporter permease [Streptomyces hainanensis]|nr:ABC transporter permease [Streptomyces hainanensis]